MRAVASGLSCSEGWSGNWCLSVESALLGRPGLHLFNRLLRRQVIEHTIAVAVNCRYSRCEDSPSAASRFLLASSNHLLVLLGLMDLRQEHVVLILLPFI